MPYKNMYYRVLGITEPCTDNEIKSAFRRKIKQIHPDNSSLNGEIEIDHDRIRELIEARDWLLKYRYTDSCDYIQFQTDSVINNYFAKRVQRAREEYAKKQKKKKRKNLQNKIDDTLSRIKEWDLRGIELSIDNEIAGEIINQKIECFTQGESLRVCVQFKDNRKRWINFFSVILGYELMLKDKDMEKYQEIRNLIELYKELKTLS